jgi:DNA-binding LacI/PurR family transcriptional regulator
MKILILEDNLIRIEKFKELFKNQDLYIAKDIQHAKEHCNFNEFPVMLLDHDLGNQIWVDSNEENTGYQFVKWLIENNLQKNALIYIHSCNPIGANKMLSLLLDNGYDGIWHPFLLWKIL